MNRAENGGPEAIVVDVLTRLIGFTAVALRFWARRVGGAPYWLDDWFILAAAIYLIPVTVAEIVWAAKWGLGRHVDWLLQNQPEILPTAVKILYADEGLYAPNIAIIKLSILCLYLRLFGVRKAFKIICYVQITLVLIWAVVSELVVIFQCSPISAAWSVDRTGAACFQYPKLFLGVNVVNVTMDVWILCTPIYSIWKLKLSVRKRILVSSVMAVGLGELIFCIIRLVKLYYLTFADPTWDAAIGLLWSNTELNVAIVCACIPTMAPLLPRNWVGRSKNNSMRAYNTPSSGAGGGNSLTYLQHRVRRGAGREDDEHELVGTAAVGGGIRRTTDVSVHSELKSNGLTTEIERKRDYTDFDV